MYWLLASYRGLLTVLLVAIIIGSCTGTEKKVRTKPLIVCTTGMIGDAVKNIVGEYADVETIMGPGVDPHLYKATHGDLVKFQDADMVVYNGLHLEGKMGDVLEKVGRKKPVIAVAEKVAKERLINNTNFQGAYDPHIWFDVALWNAALKDLADALPAIVKAPEGVIYGNYVVYSRRLDSLDKAVKMRIENIPSKRRKLVTAHDAFEYFGRAYSVEVKGLQGISTLSEFGLRDVSELVDFIVKYEIPSIYTETSVSKKSIEAVIVGVRAKGVNVQLGGSLYSDAMGDAGTPEGNYIGMVNANVDKIMKGLSQPIKE
ncbi:MAG: manganese/zinc/iron transport system substrate-binding protein [Marivirga sp.]|jgi:manganese/zinc/iron transport system substrate-binding protein